MCSATGAMRRLSCSCADTHSRACVGSATSSSSSSSVDGAVVLKFLRPAVKGMREPSAAGMLCAGSAHSC